MFQTLASSGVHIVEGVLFGDAGHSHSTPKGVFCQCNRSHRDMRFITKGHRANCRRKTLPRGGQRKTLKRRSPLSVCVELSRPISVHG